MSTPSDRLRVAREAAGYATASEAARAMGVGETAYFNHENGWRGITRSAERYARFFRVSLDWLLTGRGDMKGERRAPLYGAVGAGARVDGWLDGGDHVDDVDLPDLSHAGALRVVGTSQWPKWAEGDVILFDTRARRPSELVNHYCVVETVDGDRLIKLLRKGPRADLWTLESHNAPPEQAELRAAYCCLLTLAR